MLTYRDDKAKNANNSQILTVSEWSNISNDYIPFT